MDFATYLRDKARIEGDARFCSLGDGDRAALLAAAPAILADAPLLERLAAIAGAIRAPQAAWDAAPWRDLQCDPRGTDAPPPHLAYALAFPVLANVAAARADYAERAIPECILAATLRDLPRWTDDLAARTGGRFRGFTEVNWLREALSLRLFELGSLQFQTPDPADGAGATITVHIPKGEKPDIARHGQSLALAPNFFAKFLPDSPAARARNFQWAHSGDIIPIDGVRRRRPLRLGVLGSGSGSNMQSIQDAIEAGTLDAEIKVVITDVPGARILDRAARHSIPARHIDHAPFKTKLEGRAEDEVIAALRAAEVDVVVLAGYMRVVKPKLLAAFPDRVINIHPALLPSFPGIEGWTQALNYGAKVAGCTVHFVNAGIDSGPIIVQKAVPVEDSDTPASLHARIQVQEHVAYPEALRLLAADRLLICGRRVITL